MKRCALLVALCAGCYPILVPPVHVKAGGAFSTTKTQYEDHATDNPGYFSVGFDTANVSELPFTVGAGTTLSFNNTATYLEGGWIRRILPWLRLGASGATEWWIEEPGFGVRTGITLELTTRMRRGAGKETEVDYEGEATDSWLAYSGSLAIGGYIDVGHRWMRDEPNHSYVCVGISIRLPAFAGIREILGSK
jgi:hypothetical protein